MIARENSPKKALFWMTCSTFCFSVINLVAKQYSDYPTSQLVFYRSFGNFIFLLPILFFLKIKVTKVPYFLLFLRALAGTLGIACLFFSLHTMHLSTAAMFWWMAPLFVLLFGKIFTKETFPKIFYLWMIFVFVGLLKILQFDPSTKTFEVPLLYAGVGILGAILSSFSMLLIRKLTITLPSTVIVFYFMLFATIMTFPFYWIDSWQVQAHDVMPFLLLGSLSALAQVSMTTAYRYAEAGVVSTLGLSSAGFSAIWGYIFFDEILTNTQWMGMVWMSVGISFLALRLGEKKIKNLN